MKRSRRWAEGRGPQRKPEFQSFKKLGPATIAKQSPIGLGILAVHSYVFKPWTPSLPPSPPRLEVSPTSYHPCTGTQQVRSELAVLSRIRVSEKREHSSMSVCFSTYLWILSLFSWSIFSYLCLHIGIWEPVFYEEKLLSFERCQVPWKFGNHNELYSDLNPSSTSLTSKLTAKHGSLTFLEFHVGRWARRGLIHQDASVASLEGLHRHPAAPCPAGDGSYTQTKVRASVCSVSPWVLTRKQASQLASEN